MTEVTEADIIEVLSADEAKSQHEIAQSIHEGEVRCSECGQVSEEFEAVKQEVKRALREALDNTRITTTPDWEYRLAETQSG